MDDDAERRDEIARLREQLSEAKARRASLSEELVHFAVRVHEIRREFGNPFYYSHPAEPDEGIANYSANNSHAIGMPTFRAWRRVEREVERLHAELRRLGADGKTDC
jgi:hypothetical protein